MSQETKHTPGPWFIFGNGHCVGGPGDANATAGVAMCGMAQRDPEECAANARLISAAPDLLAACKAQDELWTLQRSGFIEKYNLPERTDCDKWVRELRRAAISLATGEGKK